MISIKRSLTSLGVAAALVAFVGVTGCEKKASDGARTDSAAVVADTAHPLKVDTSMGGNTTVKAEEKDYDFDGVISAVSGDMVTIQHEAINDYKPAGSDQFKLAQSDMAQYIKKGDSAEFTVKVAGDQATITEIQKEEEGD
jgi:Cu/Ag efflux protein CusF